MFGLPPMLVAALTGFISGLLVSIPVGPINLTIVNEGARRGFKWAALIGLGATVMELIYCFIAFTGFALFFQGRVIKAVMELFSFVFMLYLGVKFIRAKKVQSPTQILHASTRLEERIEAKFHPHSAFMTGLVRVMSNPGVLLFWIFLATSFTSHDWVQQTWPSKLTCLAGVAGGVGLWFFGLSWAVSFGHGKFSDKTLLRMEHGSGVGLLILAFAHGAHIIWQITHHQF
jgi:threonine/homoserine/homoserine lactone efflux protein